MARVSFEVFKAREFLEGAGFKVRRTVGCRELQTLDPFKMLDHFGPITNPPGTAVGAPDHPHCCVEIITYILQGGMYHHDTLGNALATTRGESMLMHAGSGLVHSETAPDDLNENGGEMEGFQIWYTLPKADRMGEPTFQKLTAKDYPTCIDKSCKVKVKLLSGKIVLDGQEVTNKVANHRWPLTYLDIRIRPYGEFVQEIEAGFQTFVYCYRGAVLVSTNSSNEKQIRDGEQANIKSDGVVQIKIRTSGQSRGRVLLLSSKPHGDPVFQHGSILAPSRAELEQLVEKAYAGGFGSIPGAEERRRKTEAILAKKRQLGIDG